MPTRILLVALALLLVGSTAWAILPVEGPSYEIAIPAAMANPTYDQLKADEASRVIPGWDAFVSERGQGWFVAQYRRDLGSPAAMIGPSIPLLDPAASQAEVKETVRQFALSHADILKVDPNQLGAPAINDYMGKIQVLFPQTYHGLEVVGGRAEVYVAQGKVIFMGAEFYPGVNVETIPALTPQQAQAASIEGLPFDPAQDQFIDAPRLVIYPLILQDRPTCYLAYEVKLSTKNPVGFWWTYVDASDGQILSRINNAGTFDIPTYVHADVHHQYASDPLTEHGNEFERVLVNSTTNYTDANGNVVLSVPLDQPYTVTTQLRGRYSAVFRDDGAEATWTGLGTPGVPLDIKFGDSNSHVAERDGYYSHNRVHNWLKSVDPTFTSLDYQMFCNVNISTDVCNAYWNGNSINFYKEGGGCVNMATISDVVMHEYGHAITQYTYTSQPIPTANGMGEGMSDIVAQTITNDYLIGRGINGGSGFIRDGRNTRQYPGTSCGSPPEVHCLGEILMGAMWKTRTNLISTYGYGPGVSLYDRIMRATWKSQQITMPNYLTRMLVYDDDNANLNDGTPDWNEICNAFTIHNLPCPAITQYVSMTHTPLDDQLSVVNPYEVLATIEAINCGTLVPDSLRVRYRLNGETTWSSAVMTPTGGLNEYHGFIPAQDCGTLITYYLRAASSTNVHVTLPERAPRLGTYQFLAGPQATAISDDYEADLGWTVGAPTDSATAGIWQRVDPVGKTSPAGRLVQPEDDHTADPGVNCYVTDGVGGYYLNGDVGGGATTMFSPIFNFPGALGTGEVDFWAFFENEFVIDDTLRVSVSNDAGATWHDLVKIWGQEANEWKHYRGYYTDSQVPFTSQMKFRVRIANYNGSLCEGAVDDFKILYSPCDLTAAPEETVRPSSLTLEQSRPNPMQNQTTIRFALPAAGPVTVDLFDAGGRIVRTLAKGPRSAGVQELVWDGRDDAGHAVPSGVYYYRVQANGQEQTRKMLMVK
jgi:Zn-dependent metalloprotease